MTSVILANAVLNISTIDVCTYTCIRIIMVVVQLKFLLYTIFSSKYIFFSALFFEFIQRNLFKFNQPRSQPCRDVIIMRFQQSCFFFFYNVIFVLFNNV